MEGIDEKAFMLVATLMLQVFVVVIKSLSLDKTFILFTLFLMSSCMCFLQHS